MKRLITTLAVFALLGVAAYAKTLDFNCPAPTKVGNVTLAPGHYQAKIEGTTAAIKGPDGKVVTVKVKMEETGTAKTGWNVSDVKDDNGSKRLVSIDMADTTTRVVFVQ